jgi:hypothetical protein
MDPTGNVRRLRRNQTRQEKQLWHALRAGRFAGIKFRRQHPNSGKSRLESLYGKRNIRTEEGCELGPMYETDDQIRARGLLSLTLSSFAGEGILLHRSMVYPPFKTIQAK